MFVICLKRSTIPADSTTDGRLNNHTARTPNTIRHQRSGMTPVDGWVGFGMVKVDGDRSVKVGGW